MALTEAESKLIKGITCSALEDLAKAIEGVKLAHPEFRFTLGRLEVHVGGWYFGDLIGDRVKAYDMRDWDGAEKSARQLLEKMKHEIVE